jgi:hypothetical protein
VDPIRAETRGGCDLKDGPTAPPHGLRYGPDALPPGLFEPFAGDAQPDGKPPFLRDLLFEPLASFHPAPLSRRSSERVGY